MHTSQLRPATPADVADWSSMAELQCRMVQSVEALSAMADNVGLARHVREYDGDRRKRALSRAMAAALAGGESVSKSEAEARASEPYSKELAQLGKEYAAAEQVIVDFECKKLQWETARSLLSFMRESVKTL